MANDGNSPYQQATKTYFQMMSIVVLVLSSYFIFKMNLEGADMLKTPFFWFIVLISLIALVSLVFAGKWSSKFGKEHYYPEMKKWDYMGLPAMFALLLSYILPQATNEKWGVIASILLISASTIYMGIISVKNKMFLFFGFFKTSPEAARVLGIILIGFGALFSLVLLLVV